MYNDERNKGIKIIGIISICLLIIFIHIIYKHYFVKLSIPSLPILIDTPIEIPDAMKRYLV